MRATIYRKTLTICNSPNIGSITVIQISDVHSTHIYLAVLFPHNCYPIYSLTL